MIQHLIAAEIHLALRVGPLVTVLAAVAAGLGTWAAGEALWGRRPGRQRGRRHTW